MSEAGSSIWAFGARTVQVRTLGIAALVLTVALEGIWRARYGMSSPALGLPFLGLCFLVGRLAERGVHGRASAGFAEGAATGAVLLAVVYELTQAAHLHVLFLPLAVILGGLGVAFGEPRAFLQRRHRIVEIVLLLILLIGAGAFASGVDNLDLRLLEKTKFEWIATPTWFVNAHAVATGYPVPDPLVRGGLLETSFGASIFPALVQGTTRLPLHVAYAVVVVFFAYAKAPLAVAFIRRAVRTTKRARLVLELSIPCVVLAWTCEHISEFPGVVGRALFFVFVIHALRARTVRSVPLLLALGGLLALTHRAEWVAAVVATLVIAVARRDWRARAVLVASTLPTAFIGSTIVRHHTTATFALFRDHLHSAWLGFEWHDHWHWWVVAACALVLARSFWPARRDLAIVLGGGVALFVVGTAAFVLVHATYLLPTDPNVAEVAKFEMLDDAAAGREGLVLACLFVALVWIAHALPVSALRIGALAGIALTGWYVHDHRWVLPQAWSEPSVFDPADAEERALEKKRESGEPEEDPAVEVLRHVPLEALVMSDVLVFGGETPHWSAYFGHRFFLLRTGRWAPAQPRFDEMKRRQELIFATASPEEALAVLHEEHVTHVIVDKLRPLEWAGGLRADFENKNYALYVIR